MRELGTSIETLQVSSFCCQNFIKHLLLQSKNINLSHLRSCVVVSEERPRTQLFNSFTTLFNIVGLTPRALNSSFGCRVNPMICFQVIIS